MNQHDYIDAGLRVFGLHGAKNGVCGCQDTDCKALFKHPIASNWQHTPLWSDEQIEVMEQAGHFDTGFGVLVSGLLIIDVDARNGGVESFNQLCEDLKTDLLGLAGFAVSTGSGNGSMHLYFKHESGEALRQSHEKYVGIDFKSSGYVVGCGSLHASGQAYELLHGKPENIANAPSELLLLLERPKVQRVKTSLGMVDYTAQDVAAMLAYIDPDITYDDWVRVGMAIHDTFNGEGLDLWDEWSAKGSKYSGYEGMQKHWHSFGKSTNPVKLGTIIHLAEKGGYVIPVTFEPEPMTSTSKPVVDILRPPGLVGEIARWIVETSIYKREHLAVAAALTAVGNIVGLLYSDEETGISSNLLTFCVAASSTGKEHVQQRFSDVMREVNMIDAMHGAIKSEQEITRNLIRHQGAYYSIDEIGIVLDKIINNKGASYFDGVVGLIMSAYTKSDSYLTISGDLKEMLQIQVKKDRALLAQKVEENEAEESELVALDRLIESIKSGIEKPFLSLIGYTTPNKFNEIFTFEQATNGFLSRALIFDEHETNPKPNRGRPKDKSMPISISNKLHGLVSARGCTFDKRVENYGDKISIPTDKAASERLDNIIDEYWAIAEDAKELGLEALPRRGYEMVAKISFILACCEGVRTIEHVNWAYQVVLNDIERKMRLARSNISEGHEAIISKIQDTIAKTDGEGVTHGVIINRCRPHKKEDVIAVLAMLVNKGFLTEQEQEHARTKKKTVRYFIKGYT